MPGADVSGVGLEGIAERLDPRVSADHWAAQVLDACRRAAQAQAEPCIVAVWLQVPSGQLPRRLERMHEAIRAHSVSPTPALSAAWEALAGAAPLVLTEEASHRLVMMRVDACTDRPPHGWGNFRVSVWPARPPAAVLGALSVGTLGVLAPELRGMTRMVPGEETVLVGPAPLRLVLGTGAGAQLHTPGVSGVLMWTSSGGWELALSRSSCASLQRLQGGVTLRCGGLDLRAQSFRMPLSPARAAAVAGRIPAVVVTILGRALPAPPSAGGWGAPLHAREGAVLPAWAESSLCVGTEWLATDGERVAWVPAGGGRERPGPGPGQVEGETPSHRLPPPYLCGVRLARRGTWVYGTADRPVEVGRTGAALGDPYLADAPLRVAPARGPRTARLELASVASSGRPAWVRGARDGEEWMPLEPGAAATVPLPAEVVAGSLWLDVTDVPLDSVETYDIQETA